MMMHQKPTVDVPPWSSLFDDPTAYTLHRHYLDDEEEDAAAELDLDLFPDAAIDAYSCDEFRMFEFKVRRCARGRSHDWTECPYAHPGEKARRRDPRKYHYSGTACPDFRKGSCKRGDACDMAHGVFECWLHPSRYRTQPCKDGTACRRRVCFFAHTPEQLRICPQSPKTPLDGYDGSPVRQQHKMLGFSPPVSPTAAAARVEEVRVGEVVAAMRKLQLGRVNSMRGGGGLGFGGFCSLPTTPTRAVGGGLGFGGEEVGQGQGQMERVESGRELRAKMYERLSKESGLVGAGHGPGQGPDVGWVSELVK